MVFLGIVGSPKKRSTYYMVERVLKAAGGNYEIIALGDYDIFSCKACRGCSDSGVCVQEDDMKNILNKMKNAEGFVFGSPTYFSNVSGIMKNFMDRCLPFYFFKELENKKVVVVTSANFKEDVEFDEDGNCLWHNEETDSAKGCLEALRNFSKIWG